MRPIEISEPLRQGDICALEHIPIWHITKARIMRSPDPKEADEIVIPTWERAEKTPDGNSLVVVASQCCDLENPKKGNRIGVLVAPLMRIPASPVKEADRYKEIISSQDVDAEIQAYRWIQLFPFTLPVDEGQEVVADMSAMTTMAPAAVAVEELQHRRLWTLDDDERHRFRIKLGAMVGRNPDLDRPDP